MTEGITPRKLHDEMVKILVEESNCSATWPSRTLDVIELTRLWIRLTILLESSIQQARLNEPPAPIESARAVAN